MRIQTKTKQNYTNDELLIKMSIEYGIDIWVFSELFIKQNYDFKMYEKAWNEVTRIHMTKYKFKTFRSLCRRSKAIE